jgi:P27 family predicted phage terminase small subunit
MGKPGAAPPKKQAGTAIHPMNGQRAVLTEPGKEIDLPEVVDHPMALEAWKGYWSDPVSSILTESDKSVVIRWITMLQRYWTLMDTADEQPVLYSGSNGKVAHPLYKVALAMENQIERLETKLGIGPKSRFLLGIQIINQERSKRELERGKPLPALPFDEEDDPRL